MNDYLIDVRGLVTKTWKLFSERVGVLVGITLLAWLVNFLIAIVAAAIFILPAVIISGIGHDSGLSGLGVVVGGFCFVTVVVIACSIVTSWSSVATISALDNLSLGVKEAYLQSKKYIWSSMWLMFIFAFIEVGSYMLFFVPGVIFSVLLFATPYILITEGTKGMGAIFASREYVRGRFWYVALRLAVPFIVGFIVSTIFSSISENSKSLLVTLPTGLLSMIFSLLFTPFMSAYSFLLYKSLKDSRANNEITISTSRKLKYIVIPVIGYLVVPVVAILLGLVIFSSINSPTRLGITRDSIRTNDTETLKLSLEMYRADSSITKTTHYPSMLSELVPAYLAALPKDPKSGLNYAYTSIDGGKSYILCVVYETQTSDDCYSPSY